MGGLDPAISLAENYRVWAQEARGRSPAYVTLSNAVADDRAILDFLGTLPPDKRQPNLLFAAAWYLLGTPADPGALRNLVRRDQDRLTQVMLTRRTQTNEAARCATLLPALAQLPEPLALIEVGASAGLTLLFDHYSYDYGDLMIAARTRGRRRCAAACGARSRSRPGSRRSPGGPGWTSTRWMSPATTTCAGCHACCGRAKATARSALPSRSPRPAALLP